jgi:multiple sugar transport system permease protein
MALPAMGLGIWMGSRRFVKTDPATFRRLVLRLLMALGAAVVGGVLIAMAFALSKWVEIALFPIAVVLQVTPIVAIAPLNLIYVDSTTSALLICAWIVAFFPILSNTVIGLKSADSNLRDLYQLYGATPWQQFRHVTLPLLSPIIAVVMTFSVLFTFTDFQLIYVLTRGGPLNATHLMATLSFQRAISGGALGEGAAIAIAMVPFLLAAILFSYFGLQRRTWQQGGSDK